MQTGQSPRDLSNFDLYLQLAQAEKLRDAMRTELFPSAEMVVSMSREFGVPITAEDFEGLSP